MESNEKSEVLSNSFGPIRGSQQPVPPKATKIDQNAAPISEERPALDRTHSIYRSSNCQRSPARHQSLPAPPEVSLTRVSFDISNEIGQDHHQRYGELKSRLTPHTVRVRSYGAVAREIHEELVEKSENQIGRQLWIERAVCEWARCWARDTPTFSANRLAEDIDNDNHHKGSSPSCSRVTLNAIQLVVLCPSSSPTHGSFQVVDTRQMSIQDRPDEFLAPRTLSAAS
ncbi:hypothetical protein PM082_010179 [Marasmius tenuissimus]|nr:hypothetical protein PM082_010179 [Marasmius tenuissimus]